MLYFLKLPKGKRIKKKTDFIKQIITENTREREESDLFLCNNVTRRRTLDTLKPKVCHHLDGNTILCRSYKEKRSSVCSD